MADDSGMSRRDFLRSAGVAALAGAAWVGSRKGYAQNDTLKAGLIGCGGRGQSAVRQWLEASENVTVIALADLFEDRVKRCRDGLVGDKGIRIPDEMCFTGFDCYQRLIETDVDVVLSASTPYFRQFEFPAAIAAGKHVFMEKPIAVDPVGAKRIAAAATLADEKGLNVVVGTQRRHEANYLECKKRVDDGAIGDIVGARAYWVGGPLGGWERTDKPPTVGEQIRSWQHFYWLSGDHIVEQHVHNIDACLWFMGKTPVSALGMGFRGRKTFGDSYDFFAVDFDMGSGIGMQSLCRQVAGCDGDVSDWVIGTKGYANCWGAIFDASGAQVWGHDGRRRDPYVQEHADLANAIRGGEHVNDAHAVVKSCIAAIMGRTSAYTGKRVSYDQIANAGWQWGPKEDLTVDLTYDSGPVPVPGVTTY